MIQGGDPTGTGSGGESIYGFPFKDEFHQRLRFSRRGIVAMANSGKDSNGSQFFITFGDCEHLNKKHTIFGKITGDTIYNLMALQSLDTDSEDRPVDPPVIRRTKVVLNPFDDLKLNIKKQEATQQIDQKIVMQ
jgi:peptidyl-prolyl cis-trans isomerase SDCCAG10